MVGINIIAVCRSDLQKTAAASPLRMRPVHIKFKIKSNRTAESKASQLG